MLKALFPIVVDFKNYDAKLFHKKTLNLKE